MKMEFWKKKKNNVKKKEHVDKAGKKLHEIVLMIDDSEVTGSLQKPPPLWWSF